MENLETTNDQISTTIDQHWKEEIDHMNKQDLLLTIEQWKLEDDYSESSQFLKVIRQAFDVIVEQDKADALQKFTENGEDEKDFQFKKDNTVLAFDKAYDELKERLHTHYKDLETTRAKNLKRKNELLEELRQLVAAEDGPKTIVAFNKIQNEWKSTGPVPAGSSRELNANYHGLLDIFYNNRSIYFELRDLDRKKNSELKAEVCVKMESLLHHKDAIKALHELRKLQEEYKEIGQGLKEEGELIHARYKETIDKLMQKKDAFIEELKKKREENLVLKKALIAKLVEYKEFATTKIDAWKEKTAEILALQTEWKKIGAVAQEVSKELNDEFWSISKAFYNTKHDFFKGLDDKRKENLQKKVDICEQAEALQVSDDFAAVSKQLIRLQEAFNKVGQVPIKQKDSIYKRFKTACDTFFNRQREQQAAAEKDLMDNVAKKSTVCREIEEAKELTAANIEATFNAWIQVWSAVGEVPRQKMAEVQTELSTSLQKAINKLSDLSADVKEDWLLKLEVIQAKAGGDAKAKLEKLEKDLSRKTKELVAEVDRYKTNMEFWGRSKNADKIKAEIQSKIVEAEEEIKLLAKKMRILRD